MLYYFQSAIFKEQQFATIYLSLTTNEFPHLSTRLLYYTFCSHSYYIVCNIYHFSVQCFMAYFLKRSAFINIDLDTAINIQHTFFKKMYSFIWERERESASMSGEGAKRVRENLKQTACWTQSLIQGFLSWPRDHDLNWNQGHSTDTQLTLMCSYSTLF